ncbi:pseudouridine synthase [Hydrocarboniphaga effusa]|uniref:pseudouridine synthase n=1 Tax=Hydrocarboniphaga effusa TaxID=243629 RepID=UPI003BAC4F4E
MVDRIQKLLATAGIASRRAIETMIAEGRVTVNGRPAEIGQKIDHNDSVRVDTKLVPLSRKPESTRVLLYRKRVGELVTRDDPDGRKTVFRKLPELETGRWIAVGRLDINTSGLLLLTNDGELARRLMHPSFEMRREYAVRVLGSVDAEMLDRLRKGVELEDGFARFETIQPGESVDLDEEGGRRESEGSSANSWWNVTVRQGRNRVVRRLLESQGLQVSRLMRVSYGPIALGRGIKSGTCREATPEELQALLEAVAIAQPRSAKAGKRPSAQRHDERRKPEGEFVAPTPEGLRKTARHRRPERESDRDRDRDRERSLRERFPHAEALEPASSSREGADDRRDDHERGFDPTRAGPRGDSKRAQRERAAERRGERSQKRAPGAAKSSDRTAGKPSEKVQGKAHGKPSRPGAAAKSASRGKDSSSRSPAGHRDANSSRPSSGRNDGARPSGRGNASKPSGRGGAASKSGTGKPASRKPRPKP